MGVCRYNLTWEGIPNRANTSLTSYYVNAIDALYPICPDCLFLVEGGGQYKWCGVNWGNGFITNQTLIKYYGVRRIFVLPICIMQDPFEALWEAELLRHILEMLSRPMLLETHAGARDGV